MRLGVERKPEDSDKVAGGSSGRTQLQQPASSTYPTRKDVESGNGIPDGGVCPNASTDELGGHADVTGSSTVLPLRSISSSGALHTRMRSQRMTTAKESGGDDNAASEGDLLNCLLRAAGTTAGGGVADSSGLALRRRRQSNTITDMDTVIRERTSSPVGAMGDFGQRMVGRRRSLPTPRLSVRDVACAVTPLRGTETSTESSACSGIESFSNAVADSIIAGVRQDERLSDIDENVATTSSSTSTVPDISLTTNNTTTNFVVESSVTSPVDVNLKQEIIRNTIDGRKTAGDMFITTRAVESRKDDAVKQQVFSVTGGSSTDSLLHQSRSTVGVDVTETGSSTWLPRRSQSLRLYRFRDRGAARGDVESQQLDVNVHEFQTRAAPEREALRNRLRKLSLIYASTTDSDETSRTWPASRRPCADSEDSYATPTSAAAGIPLQYGHDVVSASSSTSTLQLKYDTDSLSSQKDEGFETASISSDVYLSSSQRSSMCDCDAALTIPSAAERQTDPTTTKATGDIAEPQLEILPPPPASLLNELEALEADTPRYSGDKSVTCSTESVVLPRSELGSADQPSSNTSVVSTASIKENRLSKANTKCGHDGSPGSVKNVASSRKTSQTVGTRQTKAATRAAPATPGRVSSLVVASASRNVSLTSATAAGTNSHAAGRTLPVVKSSSRPPRSDGDAPTSTSGRHAAFQRSSPLRSTDDRKLALCSRGDAQPSSSAFVRQSQTRATIAAPVLRTNKRAAAEARKMKAATSSTTTITNGSESSSSRVTTTTASSSSSVVRRPERVSSRTASSGSCSSTTPASTGPKLASFRSVSSGITPTTLHQPPSCASSKKPDSGAASSSSKVPSNLRHSTQPSSSRLRAPVATKKQCSQTK